MKKILLLIFIGLFVSLTTNAQGWLDRVGKRVKERVEDKVEDRIVDKADKATEKVMDSAEDSVTNEGGESEDLEEVSDEDTEESKNKNVASGKADSKSPTPVGLVSYSKYDFVPGDKILYFEDFSRDAIGDFPANWTTNGSGEVKNVNIASGNWFHLNGEDAVYNYLNKIEFPENFIVEFDIIPDKVYYHGITFTLYDDRDDEFKELNSDLYPGKYGLQITLENDGWSTKGYDNINSADWITGRSSVNPLLKEQVNHVIIWLQKRRVRIYHQGSKVLDNPTNIHNGVTFSRLMFSGWDANSFPMVSNLKVTTASPDMRSKLITEGKIITYGITFDVNKADIKPESFGTLNSIATVLKENPDVKVKIVGHTDADGDDASNLSLSKKRAESVKNELVSSFAIDAGRLQTDGLGESQPLGANDNVENKARNRRVEFLKI